MQYRRAFYPGRTLFFTLVTHGRRPIFASDQTVDILRTAFRRVRDFRSFEIDAFVVLPDHLHCIWTLPPDDTDFATRWRLIKTWFTKNCPEALCATPDAARVAKHEAVWQHRYWEHLVRDDHDHTRHVDDIHYNPVKHGPATSPMALPYSSFRKHVAAGIYPAD